jgi:SAM-dependent methyltransferase
MDSWVLSILADPITKQSVDKSCFRSYNGILDARIFLKHTPGYQDWNSGQLHYEQWENANYKLSVRYFREVIEYDRPIYQRFPMAGRILDIGGGRGTVREFLDPEIDFISTDPWLECMDSVPSNLCEAFVCLKRPLNFIAAMAEFQPFVSNSFDWVHMRSMLDHVQVPDLTILEARRVLKHDGHLLVGLLVEGGKSGVPDLKDRAKEFASRSLEFVGIGKWKDHHTWHPTFKNLLRLLEDNGFISKDVFWQPHWKNKVCYILAAKSN